MFAPMRVCGDANLLLPQVFWGNVDSRIRGNDAHSARTFAHLTSERVKKLKLCLKTPVMYLNRVYQ
jgi:hypothetical protein